LSTRGAPNFLLKIIPHVDGRPRICEIVEYRLTDINLKGAWLRIILTTDPHRRTNQAPTDA
jgi:acetoacetate decarboxylase